MGTRDELDPFKPMIRVTKDGIQWETRNLFYVKVDGPDAHKLIGGNKSNARCIEMCPWNQVGSFQTIVRKACKEGMIFWQLKQEVHDWIAIWDSLYVIDRRWDGEEFGWKVGFIDKGVAAAFKLRWAA